MEKLLQVKNLIKHYECKQGLFGNDKQCIHAVNDVSFSINKGEILAIVGESGCGKSTTARCLIRLEEPTSGEIFFKENNITKANTKELKSLRSCMQMIFQNPYSSLNPKMKIKDILSEPLKINTQMTKQEIDKQILEIADLTGISKESLDRYPHEFSGGQRQRIGIARAIILKPEFIIADEPVSALDVSIQAQILNLLKTLKYELNLTYLFISHDLSVVRYMADRIAVMYLGEIVEIAKTDEIFENPKHPYTQILLNSLPQIGKNSASKTLLSGDLPSPANLPKGCKFASRCPYVEEICQIQQPPKKNFSTSHQSNCHLYS